MQPWNIILLYPQTSNIYYNDMGKINKQTLNIWKYKVGNNANIVNLVRMWKLKW